MTLKDIIKKDRGEDELHTVIPVVNIREQGEAILLEAEMPGLDQSNISVEVQADELVISGKRESDAPKGYLSLHQERCALEYRRSFTLGRDIDRNNVKAHYENGILTIKLEKSEEAQPKKITIT